MELHSSRQVVQDAPIFRLPTEMFLAIAVYLVHVYPPSPPRRSSARIGFDSGERGAVGRQTLGWCGITYVCSRWRSICIGTPILWTYWIGRLPDAISMFLSRSGPNLPLHVDVQQETQVTGSGFCMEICKLLPWPRIASMTWTLDGEADITLVLHYLFIRKVDPKVLQLTSLRTLELNAKTFPSSDEASLYAPVLQYLFVSHNIYMHFDLPQLEELVISTTLSMVTPELLDSWVGRSPMLRKLTLVNCNFAPDDAEDIVAIQSLDELKLEWNTHDPDEVSFADIFGMLLTNVDFPLSVTVDVVFNTYCDKHEEPAPDRSIWSAVPFCVSFTSRAPEDAPNALVVGPLSFTLIQCAETSMNSPYADWLHGELPNARIRARIQCKAHLMLQSYLHHSTGDESENDVFHSITILSLECCVFQSKYVHVLFEILRFLRTLRIGLNGPAALDVLGLLSENTAASTPLLPALETLWLEAPPMGVEYPRKAGAAESVHCLVLYSLHTTLRARKQAVKSAGPHALYLQGFVNIGRDDACTVDLKEVVRELVIIQ